MTSAEQKQLEDVNMKIKLAKEILEACEIEKRLRGLRFPINHEARRFSSYLGSEYHDIFYDSGIQRSANRRRTLKMMLDDDKNSYCYTQMRQLIFDLYVNKRLLPTKPLLRQELTKMGICNIDTLSKAFNLNGFVWTPLPNYNKCILVEKPEQLATRFQYLKQIFKYRSENRPIVYIEEGNYNTFSVTYNLQPNNVFVIAANRDGVIDIFFLSHLDEKHNDYFEKFIMKIAHLLPKRCVLVLNERPHHMKKSVPTEFSSRKDMMEWLKDCKVPFEETMHSGELFALIQRTKHNFPLVKYRLEDIAKQFDAEVVYKPFIMLLNFFQHVTSVTSRLHKRTKGTLVNLKNENIDWNKMEDVLIETEQRIFEEDMKMEVIIDKLMMMASDGKVSEKDAEQLQDSDYECSVSNMSDIVIL